MEVSGLFCTSSTLSPEGIRPPPTPTPGAKVMQQSGGAQICTIVAFTKSKIPLAATKNRNNFPPSRYWAPHNLHMMLRHRAQAACCDTGISL